MAFFRYIIFFPVVFAFAGKNTTDVFRKCNVTSMKLDQEIIFSGPTYQRKPSNKNPLQKIVCLICKYKSLNDELISEALKSIMTACGKDICVDTKDSCQLQKSGNFQKVKKVQMVLYNNWLYLGSTNSETRNSNYS